MEYRLEGYIFLCVPLYKDSFGFSGNEIIRLSLGLGPAPRIFTKLLKVPIGIRRLLKIRIIMYLENMSLMSHTLEELSMVRGTLIFVLQHLGFVINVKKSILSPVEKTKFLGLQIYSLIMTFTLLKAKVLNLVSQCQEVLQNPTVPLWKLASLIGCLRSTAQAVMTYLQD